MKHEARKSTKIVTVACGWAFCHLLCTQILKAVTKQLYEDVIRPDLVLMSLTAALDLTRIIGTTFLIEKLNRKGVSTEAKTFIYIALAVLTFLTEVCNVRIQKQEAIIDAVNSRSLLTGRTSESVWAAGDLL